MIIIGNDPDAYLTWVTAGKLLSVVFAGAFGILGLTTEFKNPETRKLTRWGIVSISGIFVSTTIGLVTQIQESAQQQKAEVAQQQKAQKDLARTLAISEQTSQAVSALRRLLAPLDGLKVTLYVSSSCADKELATFCKHVRGIRPNILEEDEDGLSASAHKAIWNYWPRGTLDEIEFVFRFYCGVQVTDEPHDPDLEFVIRSRNFGPEPFDVNVGFSNDDRVSLTVRGTPDKVESNTDRVKSTEDFAGCNLFIDAMPSIPMTPTTVFFDTKHGRRIVLNTGFSKVIGVSNRTKYQFAEREK